MTAVRHSAVRPRTRRIVRVGRTHGLHSERPTILGPCIPGSTSIPFGLPADSSLELGHRAGGRGQPIISWSRDPLRRDAGWRLMFRQPEANGGSYSLRGGTDAPLAVAERSQTALRKKARRGFLRYPSRPVAFLRPHDTWDEGSPSGTIAKTGAGGLGNVGFRGRRVRKDTITRISGANCPFCATDPSNRW